MKKKTFSRISKVTMAALLVGTMTSPFANLNAKAATTDSTVKLRFMETTDLHDAIMDYDYYQDAPTIDYGLVRTAKLIEQARGEVANSMLFDAGDLLQGNPMADYVAKIKGLAPDEVHPMYKAMGLLNYDAGILGNHEFNYGLPYLENALQEAPYDVVNANVYKDDKDGNPDNDQNYFTPYKILDKTVVDEAGTEQHIKVGVIGFVPPQIMDWDKDNLTGKVVVKDIVKTANKFIPQMKAEGADIIVAIAHSGCDIKDNGQDDAENAVLSLSKVQGIDALLFGHAHVNFPGDAQFNGQNGIDNVNGHLNGVPAMEAGFWGNNLGVMDLQLQKVDGKWNVTSSNAAVRPLVKTINGVKTPQVDGPDQAMVNAVADYHQGTLDYVRGKIGETTAPMSSYFSRVMDDPTIQIVNNAQTDYVKNWIKTNRPDLADMPIVSAGAPFKAGRQGPTDYTNIAKGDLSIKSANDLYLYNNTFKAVELTAAQIKEWLEMTAAQFNQIDPTKTDAQELINYSFQPYNFDVIDGVKYQIDVTQPARYDFITGNVIDANAHRIINFTDMNGNPIDPNQKFLVATNNYRASGGGNFPGLKGGGAKIIIDSPYENRQVLMDYIMAKKVVNPVADNNWKIAPINAPVKLVFRSSPAAKNVLASTPNIQDVGPQDVQGVTWEQYQLDQKVYVQLLGINDLHGQLDYSTKVNNVPVGGIQYLAGYLKEREAANPSNTLMVHAGDQVGASRPVSALLQDEPTINFLNYMGFDVGTIGNHEFDEGTTEMDRLIYGGSHPATVDKYGPFKGADFPYIVANVVDENTNQPILPPYAIKEVDGVKIGFIGVVTTETPSIVTPSGTAGVKFLDEKDSINKYAKELKDKGIRAIVVLAHVQGTSAADGSNPTGKMVDITRGLDPEVDIVFAGHDHAYLNSNVNGKLMVQAYSYGTAFSDVDVVIDPITQDIVSKKGEIVRTFQDPQHLDATANTMLNKYLADVAPITSQVVGQAASVISKKQNESGESAMGNLIADAMRIQTHADFGFMNVGGVRDEIKKAGDITWGDLFGIQPFGNDVVTEKITGDQIRILLNQQWSLTTYTKIMQISGLKYTYSENLPVGSKVLDIYLPNGQKIDPNAVYTVAVNNFMADGGDGFTILKSGTNRVTYKSDLDTLIEYVKTFNGAPISAQIEGRITLDNVAPAAPTVNTIAEKATVVTGTTEAGAKVEVTANGELIGTGFAGADGKFSVAIKPLVVGTFVYVTATDAGLNKSAQTKVIVMDVQGPTAPTVDKVTDKSTSVTGTTESGAKVEVSANGQVLGTATAGADGKFSVTIAAQKSGTILYVTATDAAGNKGGATSVTVADTTAPDAPTLNPVTDASTKVTGTAEAGSKVEVRVNGSIVGTTTADANGNFTVAIPKLKAGLKVTATATDISGNKSAETSVVVKDVTKPDAPVVGKLVSPTKVVTGKAEAGTIVKVYKRSTLIGQATVNSKGVFTVKLKAAYTTGTELKFTATDAAGNVSKTLTVKVVKK